MKDMDQCSIETCNGKVRSRGWCRSHYERWRRYGDPEAVVQRGGNRKRPPVLANRTCNICQQTKPIEDYYVLNGWVYRHCKPCHSDLNKANRIRKALANPKPPKVKVDHGECAYDGCDNKARVRLEGKGGPEGWFCMSHNYQWDRNGELKPVKKQKKSAIDDRFRLCTQCEKVKTQEAFHLRAGGRGRQSVCKECTYPRVRFSRLVREGRYDEAKQLLTELPNKVQDTYRKRLEAAQNA